eukprot:5869896-Alexandrium_andersonii.AAC.1
MVAFDIRSHLHFDHRKSSLPPLPELPANSLLLLLAALPTCVAHAWSRPQHKRDTNEPRAS